MSRAAWALLAPLGVFVVFACSQEKSPAPPAVTAEDDADVRPPTPPEWDRDVTRPDESAARDARSKCTFARGAMAAETIGAALPVGGDIPIDTIIVLMQENRSFDSYYGHLNEVTGRTDVESAPDDASNLDAKGIAHKYQHAPHKCFLDTAHSWRAVHVQVNDGKMDGFFATNNEARDSDEDAAVPPGSMSDGERALWWYDERDIPFYYSLATTFAIADHYHSSVPGPTWPNRMFLYAATSFGWTHNELPDLSAYTFPARDAVIFDELEKRHVDWNIYTEGPPGLATTLGTTIVSRWGRNPVLRMADFMAQAKAGKLPAVAFVDAHAPTESSGAGEDEHPPADLDVGQKFVSDVVHAMFASPQWKRSALFLTYDEHGGIYDHVPPPAACLPDAIPPSIAPGDPPGGFERLGVRVPLTVVSPFTKRGHVSHVVYDHTSITRFIEARFRLPALSARDANADPLFDMFDFAHPAYLEPPVIAEPTVDATELAYCRGQFGK
jgi:phospholipase C